MLERRAGFLVLLLADRYGLPYSVVRDRCRVEVENLLRCWESSLDPDEECMVERRFLEECVEGIE